MTANRNREGGKATWRKLDNTIQTQATTPTTGDDITTITGALDARQRGGLA